MCKEQYIFRSIMEVFSGKLSYFLTNKKKYNFLCRNIRKSGIENYPMILEHLIKNCLNLAKAFEEIYKGEKETVFLTNQACSFTLIKTY